MSLEELSLRTKIPEPRLRQIEQGNFAALPPGSYTRGILRAVAREVGCDPVRIVASLPQDAGDERVAGIAGSPPFGLTARPTLIQLRCSSNQRITPTCASPRAPATESHADEWSPGRWSHAGGPSGTTG